MRLLVALLALFPASVFADVFAYGLGPDTSCGLFIAANEGRKLNSHVTLHSDGVKYVSENESMYQWVRGLLTGVNWARDQQHQIQTDNPAIDLWLRNWCTKHPTSTLYAAVGAFVDETPGTPLK
jgi:hypothetical protein